MPAYWVVDPEEGVVWTWSPESGPEVPNREAATATWSFPEGAPALQVDIAALVAPF